MGDGEVWAIWLKNHDLSINPEGVEKGGLFFPAWIIG
jgi:hypothetical protein